MSTDNIPLVDLSLQHAQVRDDVAPGIAAVLESGAFINGPDVGAFEQEYAAFVGAAHTVGVANGTDALELALRAAGVRPGSEVVMPANTFIATAEAAARAGCSVRLVDCDEATALIDADRTLEAVGPDTGAVIPVDLFGQVAPLEAFADLDVVVI